MGHRSLIFNKNKDGNYDVMYSHWGAINALESGWEDKKALQKDIEVPTDCEMEWENLTEKEAAMKIDLLWHEAVYIDGKAYITHRQGVLLQDVETGEEHKWAHMIRDKKGDL